MARLQRGMASIRGVRGGWREKFSLCLLVEAYAGVRQAESGLQALSAMAEENIESVYAPEFYRLEGELLLDQATGASQDQEAEACFRRAIDMARNRQGKSLELRAVTSVSRLLNRQGRRDEARRMLAETYGWFTEGFDTGDLHEARELLDQLS